MLRKCNHEKETCNANIQKFFTQFLKKNYQLHCISLQSDLSESSELKNIIQIFLLKYWKRFFQNLQKISDNSFKNLQLQNLHHDRKHTIEKKLEVKTQFSSLYKLFHQLQFHKYLQSLNLSQKWRYLYTRHYFWWMYFLWWQIKVSISADDCWNE